jgi:cation diffusion facilitator CzcD-associated flavoprotein CzcO
LVVVRSCDALVVGAGPAGLATSRELSRAGVQHVVLERGNEVAHTWANLYDSLVLHTAKRLSSLPGLGFPHSVPRFPTRIDFLAYLRRYAETFRIPLETRAEVVGIEQTDGAWSVRLADGGVVLARTIAIATGIVSNPHVPNIPGRHRFGGHVLHSIEYHRPDGFNGRRVLVVGAGNSASEISVELARAGADVTLAVRTGAFVVPREIAGIPIQYLGIALGSVPKKAQRSAIAIMGRVSGIVRRPIVPAPPPRDCPNMPVIGLSLTDLLRAGTIRLKGGVAEFTKDGVRFADDSEEMFEAVILATGFRPAVGILRDLIRIDDCGFAKRRGGVESADQPNLFFVGHNYDIRGALFNIARDARLVARLIRNRRGR